MAKKKKTEKVGTIKAIDMIHASRPMQDIPFRTGVYTDKRKKEKKLIKIDLTNGCKRAII